MFAFKLATIRGLFLHLALTTFEASIMNLRFILLATALPAAASFALGGKIDGPGKPKAAAAAADVESGAVCKRMTESTEDSVSTPFELGR